LEFEDAKDDIAFRLLDNDDPSRLSNNPKHDDKYLYFLFILHDINLKIENIFATNNNAYRLIFPKKEKEENCNIIITIINIMKIHGYDHEIKKENNQDHEENIHDLHYIIIIKKQWKIYELIKIIIKIIV